jgi:DNA invertase Pin-like site-specific DNA recombinase
MCKAQNRKNEILTFVEISTRVIFIWRCINMKYFYARVSTEQQNLARQIDMAKELEIPKQNIFVDKLSGKNTKRPELQKLLSILQENDIVIVESISRFARNTKDLLNLIEKLHNKSVEFVSKKESIDTTTPTGKFMLVVFGAVAELERDFILDRQREGIKSAKARGVKFGRTAIKLPRNFGELVKLYLEKQIKLDKILEKCNFSERTFYRHLANFKQQH